MIKAEFEKKAKWQEHLMHLPPVTVEQREEFVQWLDKLERAMTHIVYAIAPMTIWSDEEESKVLLTLVGNNNRVELPSGMYCIDLPIGIDLKYRDAFALATIHFGAPPAIPHLLPEIMSIALVKPTAHERMEAKMFIKNIIKENADKPDIIEWATALSQ